LLQALRIFTERHLLLQSNVCPPAGSQAKPVEVGRLLWLRITNDRRISTLDHSGDGKTRTKFDVQMEVSG
jgi:hypothetical protein